MRPSLSTDAMTDQTADEGAAKAPATEAEGGRSKFKLKLGLKLNRKTLIMIVAPLLLVMLGGGAYCYLFGVPFGLFGLGKKVEAAPEAPKPLVFFDLPDFLVNLNSGTKKSNFLKLTVSLQIEKPEDQMRLQAVLPRIIDNCQIFLRELRVEDLRGSGGIYRLREEMLERINAVSPVKVQDVLFKEMLVQ
jgi:flagellar FliL protein